MPFELPVEITGFTSRFLPSLNGSRNESVSTGDMIRASLVAGHPEDGPRLDPRLIAWRESSIRLVLAFPANSRSRRTTALVHPNAWNRVEPSEKASLKNMLGNTITKLLAERLLGASRIWFLDLYRKKYNAVTRRRLRPDFFGRTRNNRWLSLEAKGRANTPSRKSLRLAKRQAQALRTVNRRIVVAHVVCWTMSKAGALEARLHDPETSEENAIEIEVDYNRLLRDYYEPIFEVMRASRQVSDSRAPRLFHFAAADFTIGLHPMIEEALESKKPEVFVERFDNSGLANEPAHLERYGPDGILVIPGRSWPKGEALSDQTQ